MIRLFYILVFTAVVQAQVISPRERWLMPLYDWFCPQHGTPQAAECWRYATIPDGTQVETDPRGMPFVVWNVSGVVAAPGTSGVFDPEKVLHWIDVPEAELQVGLPCSAPKGALSLRPIHDEAGQLSRRNGPTSVGKACGRSCT